MKRTLLILTLSMLAVHLWAAPGNVFGPAQGVVMVGNANAGSIKATIAFAPTNSVIYVPPGVYQESALTNKPNMSFYFAPGAIVSNNASTAIWEACKFPLVIRGQGSFTNGIFFNSGVNGNNFDVEADTLQNASPTTGGSLVNAYYGNCRIKARIINPVNAGSFGFEHPAAGATLSIYDAIIYQCCICDLGTLLLYNCTLTNNTTQQGFGGALTMFGGAFSGDWTINPNTGSVTFYNTLVDASASVPTVTTFGTYYVGDISQLQQGLTNMVYNTTGLKMNGLNGENWVRGNATELLTLATGSTTTDTTGNLLPANAVIEAVVTRVTTTITTAASFSVGDATTAGRFSASAGGLTSASTRVGIDQWSGAVTTLAAGPSQAAAAKVRITTNVNPGAGVVRITVFYRQFTAPTQ